MPDASYTQSSFLGGEFSQSSQGHFDEPNYRRGLNVCKNWIPIEEGAASRRPGTQHAGLARRGSNQARVISFDIVGQAQYDLELTPSWLRVWNGPRLVTNDGPVGVIAITSASPCEITLSKPVTWTTGQSIYLDWTQDGNYLLGAYLGGNRQFVITVIDTTHITITDQLGNNIDGSQFNLGTSVLTASRILDIATPWSTLAIINDVRLVQSEFQGLLLGPGIETQYIVVQSGAWSMSNADFIDGPYLDPPRDGSTVQASGTSGSVTLTFSVSQGFTSANIGQMIRLLSEPPAWVSGTSYTPNNAVTYQGAYYECVVATSTVNTPPTVPAFSLNPNLAQWAYAVITGVTSGTQVTVTLFEIPFPPGPNIQIVLGGPLLYTHNSGNPIHTYQMGLYWGTTWPTCGTFHEGRFWLAGAVENRADSSVTNGLLAGGGLEFMPTLYDGTVTDASGISAIFNFPEVMSVNDMRPTPIGVLALCQSAEVMIQASNFSDPITPYTVQAHQVTRYGSADMEAVQVGFSTLFVERFARKVLDFAQAIFGGRIAANNVSLTAKHLIENGVNEIRYQRETAPILWVNTPNGFGNWVGMTYKREDSFSAAGPLFAAWHRHQHGEGGRYPISMATGALPGGAIDTLTMVTNNVTQADHDYNVGHVEFLTQIFTEQESTLCAIQMDDSIAPVSASIASDNSSVTFYGFWHGIGNTISAYIGGLDCGDYVVQSNGSITVPFAPTNTFQPLFTLTYLQSVAGGGCTQSPVIKSASGNPPTVLTQPAVQSFFDASEFVHYITAVSPSQGVAYGNAYITGDENIYKFNFTTGAEINTQDVTSLGSGAAALVGPHMLDPSGNLWIYGGTPEIYEFNTASTPYVAEQTFGSGTTPPTGVTAPQSLAYLAVGGAQYMVGGSFTGNKIWVCRIDNPNLAYWGSNYGITGTAYVCSGPQNANSATAYWTNKASSTSVNLGLTNIDATAINYTSGTNLNINNDIIKNYAPTAFNGTWTQFDDFSGPAYDQTDGNVIVLVGGDAGAGTTYYLCKLRTSDGAIIWQTALTGTVYTGDASMTQAVIKTGWFFAYTQNSTFGGTFWKINTATGAATTTAVTGITAIQNPQSDDTVGAIIGTIGWDSGHGSLTLLNSTGASSSQNMLGAIYFVSPGTAASTTTYEVPSAIGYTFNSDLQLLRPQLPQDTGARNGPAVGKTRRIHKHALQLVQAIAGSISVGTNFNSTGPGSLKPLNFTTTGKQGAGTTLTPLAPFTGIWRQDAGTGDDYSFDGMLSVRVSRPYPAIISSATIFLDTQDI